MQKPDGAALLTTRSVVTFWLVLAAAFVVLHLLLAPNRTLQDALEAELLQGHLAGGYQFKNPPLYEWLLWTVQQVLGPGPLSYLVLRYGLIAAVGILFYFAVLRTVVEPQLAAAFSMSLVLFYWFGWEAHHNVSHTVALLVAVLALWLAALAYVERRTLPRAFWLGVIIGLGIMAKWSFLVVIAGFGLALATIPAGRQVFSDPRSLAIPVGVALPLIPFASWLSGLDPDVFRYYSTRSGSVEGMFGSEADLLFSLPLLLLPWILIVAALGFRYRRAVPVKETARAEIRLALIAAAAAIVLMAVVVALASSGVVIWLTKTKFAIRYLSPLSLIAALGIAGVIAPRIESERFARALATISIAAAFTILLAKLGSFVIVPAGSGGGSLIPYAGLADELTARGLGRAQFVTVSPRDAGNLAIYLPNARALSLSARIEPPPPDPVSGRPCVLLWRADRPARPAPKRFLALLGVKTEENTIEDVEVDWREPLIGVKRQSVWRLLRGDSAEQACRRVAAKGRL